MYAQIKNFYVELAEKSNLNGIELAAWTHAEFVRIHPFLDGNGRTSRLLMNYQLLKNVFYRYPWQKKTDWIIIMLG